MEKVNLVFSSPVELFQIVNGRHERRGDSTSVYIYQSTNFDCNIEITSGLKESLVVSTNFDTLKNFWYNMDELEAQMEVLHERGNYTFALRFEYGETLNVFVDNVIRCKYEQEHQRSYRSSDIDTLNRLKLNTLRSETKKMPSSPRRVVKQEVSNGMNNCLLETSHGLVASRVYNDHSDIGLFDTSCRFIKASNGISAGVIVDDMIQIPYKDSLLLTNKEDHQMLYEFSMKNGDVVRSYPAQDSTGVFYNIAKFISHDYDAQTIAFNGRNVLQLDLRADNVVCNRSGYASNMNFTAGSMTQNGHLIMGSADGTLRFYNAPCSKRAVTSILANANGEPITGIDISPNEDFVLVTSANTISIFPTMLDDGRNPFTTSLSKDIPPLRKVTLSPEHRAQFVEEARETGREITITPGKFSIQNGRVHSIVAGVCGSVVTWDISRLLANKSSQYSIAKVHDDHVIDVLPMESGIVYLSDNHLSVLRKKK